MNTTTYVRSPRNNNHPFTRISNSIAGLPATEAGIMFQILSNSDDWIINKEIVRKKTGLGKDRFERCWKNLQEWGYITIKRLPLENGKFCYHYTIFENPELQNHQPEFDIPYTETHTTVNHITVTGSTNNYQEINEAQKITASGSNDLETEWRVRPNNNNTGPNILGQEIKIEEELQIVPHPQLRFGSVRDNYEGPTQDPEITSPTQASNNVIPIIPVNIGTDQPEDQHGQISSEVCYSGKDKISPQIREILENIENIENDGLREMIDIYYTKDFPNWEHLLKQKQLQSFMKETSKFVLPDTLAIELLTEYNFRLKKEAYQKH